MQKLWASLHTKTFYSLTQRRRVHRERLLRSRWPAGWEARRSMCVSVLFVFSAWDLITCTVWKIPLNSHLRIFWRLPSTPTLWRKFINRLAMAQRSAVTTTYFRFTYLCRAEQRGRTLAVPSAEMSSGTAWNRRKRKPRQYGNWKGVNLFS